MKTHDRFITLASSKRYAAAALATVLLCGLFINPASAQRNNRGERNLSKREITRPVPMRDQPARVERNITRPNIADNRVSPNRDFNRNQNPVNRQRVITPGNQASNFNRDRNVERNVNRNVTVNRPVTNNFNRPAYNNRNYATRERPAYRPEYRYNRAPVYSAYNPSWRYNYLPRRNSYFSTLPSTYININFGGFGYRYWDGVFYRPYNNLFTVCAPPLGIYINVLPVGYRRIYVRDYPYYYYNGTYYDQRGNDYYVVSPPLGAVVESLPEGYETVVIDGETYYTIDGAQYKPIVQQNGEIWYEVIKAN